MTRFDDDGSGEVDFRKFCQFVMGTTQRDGSSVDTSLLGGRDSYVSADTGNSIMMLKRKVRMGARDMRRAFKDLDRSGHGVLNYDDMRIALHRMDIDLNDGQFMHLMKQLDANGDQQISYAEFLEFFRKEEEGMGLKTVEGLSVEQAIEMIRTKLGEKMDSRPGNLNRMFQQIDADGSGAIDFEEFKKALLMKTGLIIEEDLLKRAFVVLDDDGSGGIDFRKFCSLIMGSGKRDSASVHAGIAGRKDFVSTDQGNSEMMLFRKVRMSMRALRHSFRDMDGMGRGKLGMDDFKWVLHTHQ
jgi:Ca2+-binding EF-hand superfamily protein